VKNPTCRHIVFGACHDNGYVRTLEDFADDSAIVERTTLLYSYIVGKEFRKLPFQSTAMESIFRTTSPEISSPVTNLSYDIAVETKGMTSSEESVPAKTKSPSVGTVLINATGHRVDVVIPRPPQSAWDSWHHKVISAKMRFCRMYHLSNSCTGKCDYLHGPLSEGEKIAYRTELRGKFCHVGLKCRDVACHYRHNCDCKNKVCKFPKEMHGVDKTTTKVAVC
jgi:hypothetical protein